MTHLIVNVETTPATTPDDNMIKGIPESLERRDLLPGEHLVDKGDTDAHVLVESRSAYGVTIVGPMAEDPSWQKPAPVRASTRGASWWTGTDRWCPARQGRRAFPDFP